MGCKISNGGAGRYPALPLAGKLVTEGRGGAGAGPYHWLEITTQRGGGVASSGPPGRVRGQAPRGGEGRGGQGRVSGP